MYIIYKVRNKCTRCRINGIYKLDNIINILRSSLEFKMSVYA